MIDGENLTEPKAIPSNPWLERAEALFRAAKTIGSYRDLQQMLLVMASELHQVVDFDGIVIARVDPALRKIVWHLAEIHGSSISSNLPPAHDAGNDIVGWVFENQRAIAISDILEETRFEIVLDHLRDRGLRSLCMLPLTTVNRKIGAIGWASTRPAAYLEADISFLTLIADSVALAIDNAINFESSLAAQQDLKLNSERLEILLRITNAVVANLDLRELFQTVSANIRAVMRCDAVGLMLPDKDSRELRVFALDFPDKPQTLPELLVVPPMMQHAFETGAVRTANSSDEALGAMADAAGIGSVCCFPLQSREKTLGVLSVARREALSFNSHDVELLNEISAQVALAVENALAFRDIAELKEQLARENLYLEDEIRSELNFEDIIGRSEALQKVLKQVEVVAPTTSTVLIYGETGTGKELIARALHKLGSRAKNPFVKLNCAAIPTGLLESEMFGHERGAFTGAVSQRIGRFELADKGTVFLDEIGEVPLELQPKLLRVLQEGEFERLGNSRTLKSDARLVAATNRDLSAMVNDQKFRADLFYRLNVFPIALPSLRDRKQDIPLLVRYYVQQFARRMNKSVETVRSEDMKVLCNYSWPGNIRELQNLIERAVILSTGRALNLPLKDLRNGATPDRRTDGIATLNDADRKHIMKALDACKWVIAGSNGAAAMLGMKRSTLQTRMKKLGIRRSRSAET